MDDRIYEELDCAKAEVEKLRAECRAKTDLSESLKRVHNEQLVRIQEMSLKLEKQCQELNEKADEIFVAKQMHEDLRCNLKEREGIIKHLSSANDKLRVENDGKLRKCGEENKELLSLLEEANSKNTDKEQVIQELKKESEYLKGLLAVTEKKLLEAVKMGEALKESRQVDSILLESDEENKKLKDQLKWKKENFKHLEEAHGKLQEQFQASEKAWEKEKSALFDEICNLQDNLVSQTRISKDLQSWLEMCNLALAHEESRRKKLEVQLLESKTCVDNISAECEEAKVNLECLTSQRDKEIAALRNLLGSKEAVYKEMEYKLRRLVQENQELNLSLKELQEAQLQEAGTSSSMSKIRNKLKGLEQIHRDCSTKLRAKEAEWNFQMEKLTENLDCCRFELVSKGELVKELTTDLEGCQSLIMQLALQIEESSVMLLVLKSKFIEARMRLADEKANKDLKVTESNANFNSLKKQLEMNRTAYAKALKDVDVECEVVESLSRKVEALKRIEEQHFTLKKELDMHKEMLKESSARQLQLEDRVVQIKRKLNRVCDALDRANDELDQKFCEVNEAEFELQIWKSIAERLKANVEENYKLRKEVEASLLAQVSVEVTLKEEKESLVHVLEEKNRTIDNLQQKLVSLDQKSNMRVTQKVEGRSNGIEKEIEWWEQEWVSKELERAILVQLDAEMIHEREKKSLHQLVYEKDQRIDDLQQHVRSLEQEFENSTSSFSSQLAKMQEKTHLLDEAWEKIKTSEILKELEIQEKNLMIVELESDLSMLQKKLELQEKTMMQREHLEAELETKQMEINNLIENVDDDKRDLMGIIVEQFNKIDKFSSDDMLLMGKLGKIVQRFDECSTGEDLKEEEFFNQLKENKVIHFSTSTKKVETSSASDRSPLTPLNS